MFYAHSHQERAFNFFASFIRNVISGDERYKQLVEPIIKDAQQLAKNEIDHCKQKIKENIEINSKIISSSFFIIQILFYQT